MFIQHSMLSETAAGPFLQVFAFQILWSIKTTESSGWSGVSIMLTLNVNSISLVYEIQLLTWLDWCESGVIYVLPLR